MRHRWQELAIQAGFRTSGTTWGDRLISCWTEPHRHYHTLEHLEECLCQFIRISSHCQNATALELALWFHDAVYDPKATDNEERSAAMARQCLTEEQCNASLCDSVERLILATKTHDAFGDHDTSLLLDIDLSILGSDRARFERYEHDVRREFIWVPAEVFAEKRVGILSGFLGRPSIYQTENISRASRKPGEGESQLGH